MSTKSDDTLSLTFIRHLHVADVINFSQVCKSFHFFTTGNRAVWKDLFWKRYGHVYGSCLLCHGGLGGNGERTADRADNMSLSSCDSFDDWRDSLMGKMREERCWRVGRLDSKELRGHDKRILLLWSFRILLFDFIEAINYMCSYDSNHNNPYLCTADSSVIKTWSLETNKCLTTVSVRLSSSLLSIIHCRFDQNAYHASRTRYRSPEHQWRDVCGGV